MRLLILRLLMRISGSLSPYKSLKVDKKKIAEWLVNQAKEDSGFIHYFTARKRHIQDGFTSGITQEQYWFNCGRLEELRYIMDEAVKLLKSNNKKYAIKKGEESEDN